MLEYYIATLSGGKDSTAMLDLLLRNNYQVDYIIFNDTLDEFDEMYEYIDKLEDYFYRRYGKKITRLKPIKSYNDYIFNVRSRGDNKGKIMGMPTSAFSFCEWRRDAKILPMQRWLLKENIKNYFVYFGFTTDEKQRAKGNFNLAYGGLPLFPLIDDFNMSELDCKKYLLDRDMENPLYRHFTRTGCSKCQYQSDKSFFNLWKFYPNKWNEIKELEKKVKNYHIEAVSYHFFSKYRTVKDMEILFSNQYKQSSLFDFSDEPIKDCFCKV